MKSPGDGLKPWEVDLSSLVIAGMEKAGLARNVVRITPERQAQKLAGVQAERRGEAVASPG